MSFPEDNLAAEARNELTKQVVLAREQAFDIMHHAEQGYSLGNWRVVSKTVGHVALYRDVPLQRKGQQTGAVFVTDFGNDGLMMRQYDWEGQEYQDTLLSNSRPLFLSTVFEKPDARILRNAIARRRLHPIFPEDLATAQLHGSPLLLDRVYDARSFFASLNFAIDVRKQSIQSERQHALESPLPQPSEQ